MKGGAHAVIGAAAGFAVALNMDADIEHSMILAGAGMLSGLVPDLDTGGKLTNRISISNTYLNASVRLLGILLAFYAYFYLHPPLQYGGYVGAFLLLFVMPTLSQMFMLMLTGVIVGMGGFLLMKTWLTLFGIYIIMAALLPHRSYTHSILGTAFFGLIVYELTLEIKIEGLFAACLAGYVSHLIADMRLIPGNKRGIRPFLPFKGIEL